MQNKPLISILIVAYNPGKYLKNTLQSCLNQTYENIEILLLDNASREDITVYLPEKSISKIQLFRSPKNLGPYHGLNFLLEKAQGKYIAIQDHDDIWHSEKLEKQVDFLEQNIEYIGCGTKTIMYHEGDGKYFEYFLGRENYYTIHPSLIFRNYGKFRYDTMNTEYMCDAWSLKRNLCNGRKSIYNLEEPLTLHLIKQGSTNYSYKWYKLNLENIKRAYNLHTFLYATLTLGWELMRKICYPIFQKFGCGKWIDPIERIPFRMFGNKIKTTQRNEWWTNYIL